MQVLCSPSYGSARETRGPAATLQDLCPACPGWGTAEIHFGKHCSMTNKFWSWKWVYERTGTCGWFGVLGWFWFSVGEGGGGSFVFEILWEISFTLFISGKLLWDLFFFSSSCSSSSSSSSTSSPSILRFSETKFITSTFLGRPHSAFLACTCKCLIKVCPVVSERLVLCRPGSGLTYKMYLCLLSAFYFLHPTCLFMRLRPVRLGETDAQSDQTDMYHTVIWGW